MGEQSQHILINGVDTHLIDCRDRGLAYGDGVFETLPVLQGVPCLWRSHMQRLQLGCQRLCLAKVDEELLLKELQTLAAGESGVAKIIITRGIGQRGYAPSPEAVVNRILQFSATWAPPQQAEIIRARLCQTPLSINPRLAGIKHLNRLEQVLARSEWQEPEIGEGLMCDTEGYWVEGVSTNLFIQKDGRLFTPPLDRCGVAGVMRDCVIACAQVCGLRVDQLRLTREWLLQADALFVTNCVRGIGLVSCIGEHQFKPQVVSRKLLELSLKHMIRFQSSCEL